MRIETGSDGRTMYQNLLPDAKWICGLGFLDAVVGRGTALVRVQWRLWSEMGIGLEGKNVHGVA